MVQKTALFILLICFGCDSQSQELVVFKKGDIVPQVVVADESLHNAGAAFCQLFEEATGVSLQVVHEAPADAKAVVYMNVDKEAGNGQFRLSAEKNTVTLEGKDEDALEAAVRYFFLKYVALNHASPGMNIANTVKEISVPADASYTTADAFEYREPYFPDNFDAGFRKWNNTHTLEETWGLWGHNIGKAIHPSPKMMAQVNGKANDEQFCFTSPELEAALLDFIKRQADENPVRNKFMVMPNDNDIVCQCSRCKAVGNTKTNASPAVYTLLNKLAAKFPALQFFSTAYITTQVPPPFKTAPNAGVMISTMAFPKGVVVEQSGKKEMIDKTFAGWKAVTDKMYLWDYAVNFDDYFEAYPTISITQKNWAYYKKMGVTGIFMQGSEDMYSAYADLKCCLYAQLLMDTTIDVKQQIRRFFEAKYPESGGLIADYYSRIEDRAMASAKVLDIYGGMAQSRKKYLQEEEFDAFYTALCQKAQVVGTKERDGLKPLLAALTFLKLELMHTNGIGPKGYAAVPVPGALATINQDVPVLLDRLTAFATETGIRVYNESGLLVTDYTAWWKSEIVGKPYRNLLFGKPLKFISAPDEEYPDVKMLNDGAIGFGDYYTNWLLSTADALAIEVNADDVREAKTVEMDFLQDTRHKIYLPQRVVVTIGDKKFEAAIQATDSNTQAKHHVSIPVTLLPADKKVVVQAVKQNDYKNRSIACDEIFFK
jgi:hypothetical protein